MIVTIDGSAGSGKSTVARKLANKLGLIHLNSGALFRAIALKAEATGVSLEDEAAIAALAAGTAFTFKFASSCETLFLVDGIDISAKLHTAHAGRLASRIAVLPSLREVLLGVQRAEAGRCSSLVLEGRDAGTVVFPAAEAKFFLDASLEARVGRRLAQLQAADAQERVSFEDLKAEMEARDRRDSTRELAPQVPASDAEVIDTTVLTAEQVVEQICASLDRRGLKQFPK